VVYAVRHRRKENVLKRACYWLFYRLLAVLTKPSTPVDAGDFSVLSRRAVDLLNRMPERTRFLRGMRSWIGLKQTAFEYERQARAGGTAKYTPWKLVVLALDGVASFSHAPLRLASLLGLILAGLAVAGIFVFLYFRLFTAIFIPGYTSMIIAILGLGGMQLLTIGILGEYIGRVYEEVKQRPLFVVDELYGLKPPTG
jgi:dolichol-phosphate mannosyltransferase